MPSYISWSMQSEENFHKEDLFYLRHSPVAQLHVYVRGILYWNDMNVVWRVSVSAGLIYASLSLQLTFAWMKAIEELRLLCSYLEI